jgi:hypothetical protein
LQVLRGRECEGPVPQRGSNGVTQRCVSRCVNLEHNLEPVVCPRGFGARRSSHRCEMRNGKIMLCKAWENIKKQQKMIQTIRFLSSAMFSCICGRFMLSKHIYVMRNVKCNAWYYACRAYKCKIFSWFLKKYNMVGLFCITFTCI